MPASRRNELVDVAMRVFYRDGFQNTGIEKVLDEGGFSRMTLYNHFKSKDELIFAAMRRRDEVLRFDMRKYVESASKLPMERLLAVFDFHEQWFKGEDFRGCMFINAGAEYADPLSTPRRIALDHKHEVVAYIRGLCAECGYAKWAHLADQLNMLLEGAIVTAQLCCRSVGQSVDQPAEQSASQRKDTKPDNTTDPASAARLAKEMAIVLLAAAPKVDPLRR